MFREDGANGPSDLFLAQSSHSVAMPAKCHGQTSSPTNEDSRREQVARWSVCSALAMHKTGNRNGGNRARRYEFC